MIAIDPRPACRRPGYRRERAAGPRGRRARTPTLVDAHPGGDRRRAARSPSRGSWTVPSTSRVTATTGARSRDPDGGRRLPHGPRGPPDLRRGDRAAARAGVGRAGPPVARSRSPSRGAGPERWRRGCSGGLRDLGSPLFDAIRYRPVEVEPARLDAARASAWRPTGWPGAWRPAADRRRRSRRAP